MSVDDSDLTREMDVNDLADGGNRTVREGQFRSYFWISRDKPGSAVQDEGLRDESLMSHAARQLTLYQSALAFTSWARQSWFAEDYRTVSQNLKKCRELTTVSVGRTSDGSLGLDKHGTRLLEFKIHASARTGVSPALRISDHLMLRYGVSESETLLEYEWNF